ncbi:dTMP kinase [Ruania suaedae]|uniref:dTMP kinase n=1 Tax=Ruania suaedae TaxID=2897774 RepID=UPI001E3D6734|nr:dTMP kinase [Ruania suaedae]UFU03415.1 dTMP kinase [Ruania suaedae]
MTSGLFISFEGGDGAGKTTQLNRLADWIGQETGREVVRTREPGGTDVGQTLRQVLLHGSDLDPRTEALLFAADRAHHVASLIRPALERGAVVLTDRYLDSSVAYQAGGRALPPQEIEHLSLWATERLLPDLTVLLDLDPRHLAARIGDQPDRLERAGGDFHRRTRQAFLDRAAAAPQRWLVVDAAGERDEIAAVVRRRALALLEARA